MTVLYALLVVGFLGALLGLGLGFASRLLAVKKDERIARVEHALPGLNCGACGYAGCAAYAEAVANEEAPLTLCGPGGPAAVTEMGRIMGREVRPAGERMVAQVHCRGGRDVSQYEFDYHGLADCNALYLLYGGDKVCKYACLQLGSCIRVCPVDAIDYDSEGKVWVDRDACISCGKCVDICPTGVMRWIPYSADYIVACNNREAGKAVKKHCSVGCIACKICEKRSPDGGYTVTDNLSTIDYSYSGDRSAGAEKCPPKCIIGVRRDLQEPEAEVESPERSGSAAAGTAQTPGPSRRDGDEKD